MVQGLATYVCCTSAALPEEELPSGPKQNGRGSHGQYVYWITQPHPLPATIAALGLKTPDDYDREAFSRLITQAHTECGQDVLETVVFQELHGSGKKHNNCLARNEQQYRWKSIAENLWEKHKVRVNFAPHIRTWSEGVVYGKVASEHKPPANLDQNPYQWAKSGAPTKFEDVIPRKWQAGGFTRRTKLTHTAFLELCREHNVQDEDQAWAIALDLEEKGDKGLTTYLMENEAAASLAKVERSRQAREAAERAKMSRLEILKAVVTKGKCTCETTGYCHTLMKDVLARNGLDGKFQRTVIANLRAGRQKKRNLCIVGGTNMAKSFLLKPLTLIFKTYTRPDGGSYQLEDLLGKELVFLNDFEYDDETKRWMTWQFFKNFLEGERVVVGRPKNRGGNTKFTKDAPVFMTAPQEVTLMRGKKVDQYETRQMHARIEHPVVTIQMHGDEKLQDITLLFRKDWREKCAPLIISTGTSP